MHTHTQTRKHRSEFARAFGDGSRADIWTINPSRLRTDENESNDDDIDHVMIIMTTMVTMRKFMMVVVVIVIMIMMLMLMLMMITIHMIMRAAMIMTMAASMTMPAGDLREGFDLGLPLSGSVRGQFPGSRNARVPTSLKLFSKIGLWKPQEAQLSSYQSVSHGNKCHPSHCRSAFRIYQASLSNIDNI